MDLAESNINNTLSANKTRPVHKKLRHGVTLFESILEPGDSLEAMAKENGQRREHQTSTSNLSDVDISTADSRSPSLRERWRKNSRSRSLLFANSSEYVENWAGWAYMSYASGIVENSLGVSLANIESVDRRSSGFLMSINLQSMILGTSMLSIPYCVRISGIWSIPLILLIGIATAFTSNILYDCQYEESSSRPGVQKRVRTSFVAMCKDCWNKVGQYIMELLVYLSLIRNVVVFILLTDLLSDILASFGVAGYDTKYLSVAWMFLTLPLMFITRVSILAWVSFIGLIMYLGALGAVLVVCVLSYKSWDFSSIPFNFDVHGVGISIGIIVNSYAVHMNMPALESSLKVPEVYKRTSNLSFIANIVCKITFGLFGYLAYGSNTAQEITYNIQVYHPLPLLMKATIMFFSYFTIPLQSFVVFELIDEKFGPHFPLFKPGGFMWLLLSRLLVMTACLMIAVLIPEFGLVVSLVGSVRGSMIALILPALLHAGLNKQRISRSMRILCYTIAVLGTIGGCLGLYASLHALIVGRP